MRRIRYAVPIRPAVNNPQRGDRSREQALPERQEFVAQVEHHPPGESVAGRLL